MTGSLSTRRLDLLPSPDGLLRLSKALTILDRIMEPERPELRYFDFHEDWGGGSLATMDSGEGDYYRIWFLRAGTVVCGLDPSVPYSRVEAAQRTAEVFSALPPALSRARIEFDDVTFACHRARKDTVWVATPTRRRGKDPDGSERVLRFLDDHPETYVRHARTYFGRKVALPAVRKAYELTLDAATVSSLNDATSPRSILAFARRLGFEVAAGRATATISLPPAEVRKSLAQLADPASLAKRLAFMVLVDAIVAPRARVVRLLDRTGKRISVAIGTKGEFKVMVDGSRGCLTTTPPPSSLVGGAFTAWLDGQSASETEFCAHHDGRHWQATRWHESAHRLLTALQPNYLAWARRTYGRSLLSRPVTLLWQREPLTKDLALELNASCSWETALAEAARLGWRVRGG